MADDNKNSNPSVRPGLHTVRELFDIAGFDFEKHATVDYGAGEFIDHRLVRVGGLSFDNLDRVIDIPEEGADKVDIEVDGELKKSLSIDKKGEYRTLNELPDEAQLPNAAA